MSIYLPAVASASFARVSETMAETVRFLNARGWTPATSSNFSARIPGHDEELAISRSGVDKAGFSSSEVMIVDRRGRTVWPEGGRSSAETLIHTTLYDLFNPGAVLHTHSVAATALSVLRASSGSVSFEELELLKGLSGVTTHQTRVDLAIFPNDQDIERLSNAIRDRLQGDIPFGFLIAGHGLYTWGQTLADARRHVEVFEFLFEYALRMEACGVVTHHS